MQIEPLFTAVYAAAQIGRCPKNKTKTILGFKLLNGFPFSKKKCLKHSRSGVARVKLFENPYFGRRKILFWGLRTLPMDKKKNMNTSFVAQ